MLPVNNSCTSKDHSVRASRIEGVDPNLALFFRQLIYVSGSRDSVGYTQGLLLLTLDVTFPGITSLLTVG